MLIDISPLRKNRDYLFLFLGQVVSFLGSMITYVAIPVQIYDLTKSPLMVGLVGTVQLVPLLLFGLLGGSVADRMDRRKLLIFSELILALGALALVWNASLPQPSVAAIFVVTALMQAANGFHRPAMDALTQKLVAVEDLPAVSALGSLRYGLGSVLGPAIGGLLITAGGAKFAYIVDFATFLISLVALSLMRRAPVESSEGSAIGKIMEGVRYALERPELIGTYVVDIVAMTFAFSTALFPPMADKWGDSATAGWMFSAMSAGGLVTTLFSGWAKRVTRQGAAVVIAAAAWGVAMIAFGFATNLYVALFFIALAGGADMISGLFRGVIWNRSIPNSMRGRMAGIEMISYMTGPLIGNARAGWVASMTSVQVSIVSGGVLCVVGVLLCIWLLPAFWTYDSESSGPEVNRKVG